jgi:UDP-N-acetylmuramoylalanine--D-glutamate ligase
MINKDKLALFGYGKTTKAISKLLAGECIFFDDNTKELKVDELNNKIYPANEFQNKDFELEIATPSLYPNNPLVKNAKNLISEYDFFLSNYYNLEKKPYTIWISGTNGKTTTTQMTTHLLSKKGALSGGNIGTPLAELINKNAPIWVLETSSFTLHHTKEAKPNIYMLLPITPDHLDWHGSKEAYIADKLKPLEFMQEGELALIPKGLPLPQTNAWVVEYKGAEDLAKKFDIDVSKIKFEGAFLLDSLFALITTKVLFDEIDYNLINSFKVDAHRQEKLTDSQNRVWINDSKATNIDATIQLLELYKNKELHLILGGDDKGVDLNELFEYLKHLNLTIYAIGSNTKKLEQLSKKYNIKCQAHHYLNSAVEAINKVHNINTIALLAPAASSLDQFNSYAQRGDEFKSFVKSL